MRNAFSMLELVFVIVILGILASIAIPKFSLTRGDAQSISIQSDINQAISAIQREVFMKNPHPSQINGEYIIEITGLSKSRWIASGNGIKLAKDGAIDSQNDCVILEFINSKDLHVQIKEVDTPLCKKLRQNYEEKIIPLFN